MPTQDGVGSKDSSDFPQRFTTQYLSLDGESSALIVGEQNPFSAKFFSEYLIFSLQIVNNILLLAIYPACQDEEEQLPWLQNEVHISPDADLVNQTSISDRQSAVNRKEKAEIDIQSSAASYLKAII